MQAMKKAAANTIDQVMCKGRNPSAAAWLLVGLGPMIIGFALHFCDQASALTLVQRWLTAQSHADSWGPMRTAYEWLTSQHSGTVYRELLMHRHIKFQYPPSSLLIFFIANSIGIEASNTLLNWAGWASVGIEGAAVAAMVLILTRQAD